ncbi:hypothetical protein [Cytobacillus purgationiresistens]|uniref:hypothetical protein n=1 Tax=Cytobacillus purgationiresistens TaxID=863449 RepID=UPI0027D82F37|nr:hypothetical protein [Cytobacillus purgationiresistens]
MTIVPFILFDSPNFTILLKKVTDSIFLFLEFFVKYRQKMHHQIEKTVIVQMLKDSKVIEGDWGNYKN